MKNKNQHNYAIEYEPKFYSTFSLSSGTKVPLPVLTVSLRGGKKQKAISFSVRTCLWDIGATDTMIKRQYTNPYDCKRRSNKVEYSTVAGPYCMTHDVKVPLFVPEFSGSKIISH